MKKFMFKTLLTLGLIMLFSSSAYAFGLFYTDSSYPVAATGTKVDLAKLKQGQSDCINVLGIVEVGDAGIEKAVKNGGINKISFIDINDKTIFIFFRKITTTVYGE